MVMTIVTFFGIIGAIYASLIGYRQNKKHQFEKRLDKAQKRLEEYTYTVRYSDKILNQLELERELGNIILGKKEK